MLICMNVIFTVNPGAMSTKCALYRIDGDRLNETAQENIEHSDDEINSFPDIPSQVDYRYKAVNKFIDKHLKSDEDIIACAGRGGMLTPVPSGVIEINDELVNFSLYTPVYQHASNLGAVLAQKVAKENDVKAYIVDPVGVDEFEPVARISGAPQFPRFSFVHALNIRATVKEFSRDLGKDFANVRCVITHLGAGFSIAAIKNGRIVDNDNRMEGASMTPERAGGVPPIPLINACYSGKYTKQQIMKMLYGEAGLYAYLGTKDLREVLKRISSGDEKAKLAYEAMVYQIGKEIAAMASVLKFDLDGIIITGGMAYSEKLIEDIKDRVGKIAAVHVYEGSNENMSLAESVLRVINGHEKPLKWPIKSTTNR